MSAVPSTGHIVPMLGLAKALQLAGHEVRVATHSQSHSLILRAGLHAVPAGMSFDQMGAERRQRWPETDGQPASVWANRMWTQVMAPSTLADLLSLIEEWSPQVVIHDEGEYATPLAATLAGIPWVTHAWGSPLRGAAELVELEGLVAPMWESRGLPAPPAAGLAAHALLNPCPPLLQPGSLPHDAVYPIRPCSQDLGGPLLQADAYVGFGTVPSFAHARAELTAAVRACLTRGLRVVVTAPTAELRWELALLDERLVDAREFISLPGLLESCRLVVSHAGAGTVLAALGAGVPVVLLPRGAPSQGRMADACHRAGVGRRCDTAGVQAAIDDVLTDDAIATAAAAAAREIRHMPAAPELVPFIESHVVGAA